MDQQENQSRETILQVDDGYIGFDEILRRADRRAGENQKSEEEQIWQNQSTTQS